ncbi:Protein of unknown function [Atopomonas hussainii]|uniref:DUF2931 family protein n=1 Tax=Atopomonas hussainii TaxID=1429083 RepID=A0A1H7NTN5_9GAMM|nr:DUF2931 family protein [Atopomonas hussainii]SEL26990.1 Protein of unknown function [Atopomonas hussainii]
MSFFRLAFISVLLLSGCASSSARDPDETWFLGFGAPDYMEVWLEDVQFKDVQGDVNFRAGGGVVSMVSPLGNAGEPHGWNKLVGIGSGRYMFGYDLPDRIFVRWQSMAEPQAYKVAVNVTDEMREAMRKPLDVECRYKPVRNKLGLHLAPGGIVRVVQGGTCIRATEVMRLQAEVVEEGPWLGKSSKYHSLSPAAKEYIEKYGIPYDSWK